MKPFQSREEMAVDIALNNALMGPELLRQTQSDSLPPVPNKERLTHSILTIEDALGLDRNFRNKRAWLSGMPVRPAVVTDQSWSGGGRNFMQESPW